MFFFKQKTAYEMRISDWSSDVCSSDLRIWSRRRGNRGCFRSLYRTLRHRAGETQMTPSSMTNPIANPGQFAAEADVRAMLHDPRIVAARAPIDMLFPRGYGDRLPAEPRPLLAAFCEDTLNHRLCKATQ